MTLSVFIADPYTGEAVGRGAYAVPIAGTGRELADASEYAAAVADALASIGDAYSDPCVIGWTDEYDRPVIMLATVHTLSQTSAELLAELRGVDAVINVGTGELYAPAELVAA